MPNSKVFSKRVVVTLTPEQMDALKAVASNDDRKITTVARRYILQGIAEDEYDLKLAQKRVIAAQQSRLIKDGGAE